MNQQRRRNCLLSAVVITTSALSLASPTAVAERKPAGGAANVDGARIANADSEPGSWMSHGRTYSEQRYSPLAQINEDNVGQLGLAWFADLDTNARPGSHARSSSTASCMFTTAWSKV